MYFLQFLTVYKLNTMWILDDLSVKFSIAIRAFAWSPFIDKDNMYKDVSIDVLTCIKIFDKETCNIFT